MLGPSPCHCWIFSAQAHTAFSHPYTAKLLLCSWITPLVCSCMLFRLPTMATWQFSFGTSTCGFSPPIKWVTYFCPWLFAETPLQLMWLLPGLLWSGPTLTLGAGKLWLAFLLWICECLTGAQASNFAARDCLQSLVSLIICPTQAFSIYGCVVLK